MRMIETLPDDNFTKQIYTEGANLIKSHFAKNKNISYHQVFKLHLQTDKISFLGPTTFSKFWGKKAKATTRVTLYEPTIKQLPQQNKTSTPV